jgi:large repetitive protein
VGNGYAALSDVTISFDGVPVSTAPLVCETDASGSFSCDFNVPAHPAGPLTVAAEDASGNIDGAAFIMEASISVSPASGPVGTAVTVTGHGYAATDGITLSFNDVIAGSGCSSDATGTFSCGFAVPTNPAGSYTIRATDSFVDTATTLFQITSALTLSPSSGIVGTTVNASGSGFAAGSGITVYFDGTVVPASCTLNKGTGTFSCTTTVPNAPNGANTVEAKDTAGDSATATFTVLANLNVYPDSGSVGTSFEATGHGFAATSGITFTLNGAAASSIGACNSDAAGYFNCLVTVPPAPSGLETVVATDGSNSATDTFTVLSSVILSPADGPPGTLVTVNGYGFLASTTVTVDFNGGAVTTTPSPCVTNSAGSFACKFTVAVVPYGMYTVKGTDGVNSPSAPFTVTASLNFVAPPNGPVGTLVHASGDGYAESSAITFTFDGIAVATSCSTGATGAFSACAFTVPPAPNGPEPVEAKDGSGNSAVLSFTVVASVMVTPIMGAVGSVVTASGSGYAASSAISMKFGGVSVTTTPSPCDTNSAGSFSCSFLVPATPLSTYTVTATDASSNSASAFYTVTTSLMLSLTSGVVGSIVTATGTGYAASSTITITFNDGVVATTPSPCMTNGAGSFSCTFVVSQAPHGPEVVAAEDTSLDVASTFFSVTASITLSPNSGPAKTVVTVTGTGFAGSSTIIIHFGSMKVATCTSNTAGSFSCTFTVPAGGKATKTVTVKDDLNDHVTAPFKRT